jgi:hypothetical protein
MKLSIKMLTIMSTFQNTEGGGVHNSNFTTSFEEVQGSNFSTSFVCFEMWSHTLSVAHK